MRRSSIVGRVISLFLAVALVAVTSDRSQAQPRITRRVAPRPDSAQATRATTSDPRIAAAAQQPVLPDVTTKPIDEALKMLAWTKREIVVRDSVIRRDSGVVLTQVPAGGTPVSSVRTVTLVVSRAPVKVAGGGRGGTQPAVVRPGSNVPPPPQPPPPTSVNVDPRRIPTGTPLAPTPASVTIPTPPRTPGAPAPPTPPPDSIQGVDVRRYTSVPDLIGRPLSVVPSLLKDKALGWQLGARDYSDKVDSGSVYQQHPLAKDRVLAGSTVTVWESIGRHPAQPAIKVPSVIRLTLERARDSLRRVGLGVGHVDTTVQPRARGTVTHQDPHEGDTAHRGDLVSLGISVPPAPVAVPRLIRLTLDAARATLDSASLILGNVTLVTVEDDTVIVDQTPGRGTKVERHSLVDVVLNRLPQRRQVAVPPLEGMTREEADNTLRSAGLHLGDVFVTGDTGVGRVVAQQPLAGDSAFLESRVTITLERTRIGDSIGGEADVRMPSVLNLTLSAARRALADSGFTNLAMSGDSLTPAAIVVAQDPQGGTFAAPSSRVSLRFIVEVKETMPNLIDKREDAAREEARFHSLALSAEHRWRFVLRRVVYFQDPPAGAAPRADRTVDVLIRIPLVPPVAALGLGLGGLGLGFSATQTGRRIRKRIRDLWRRDPKPPEPEPKPKPPPVMPSLRPITRAPDPPRLTKAANDNLVRWVLSFRFRRDPGTWAIRTDRDSLIRYKKRPDA